MNTDRSEENAGQNSVSGDMTGRFSVPEMDCASCATKVESALEGIEHVDSVETRPTTGTVVISYRADGPSDGDVVAAIQGAGYGVTETPNGNDGEGPVWRSSRAQQTWVGGAVLVIGLLLEFLFSGQNTAIGSLFGRQFHAADLLFLAAVGASGREILRNGYYSARNWSLDIDLLMSVAILGALVASLAFGESLYFEAATLSVLFSVAELLERYSMDRARDSLAELMDLSPNEATALRDGAEVVVPVEDVAVGEAVAVRPGEKIPLDGDVIDGESAVNQAPITGESVPVDKTVGDEVYAGTINEAGYLEIQVTAESGDNTLSRIIRMVEDAQSNKTEREQFVERFSSYYTPVVVAFAGLVALTAPSVLGVARPTAIVYGLTLLVLACPCAFVISTPVSVVSGITSAAKNGVLIKGGNYLETMGAVDVVAFDKTGTLTKGELTVTDVVALNGNTESDVLECARGLEARSEHPIGEAIVAEAGDAIEAQPGVEVDEFESITGKGVRAELDGTKHFAGKPGLFADLGFDLTHVHATTDGAAAL